MEHTHGTWSGWHHFGWTSTHGMGFLFVSLSVLRCFWEHSRATEKNRDLSRIRRRVRTPSRIEYRVLEIPMVTWMESHLFGIRIENGHPDLVTCFTFSTNTVLVFQGGVMAWVALGVPREAANGRISSIYDVPWHHPATRMVSPMQ